MRCPADVYTPSTRRYRGIGELSYPFHDRAAFRILEQVPEGLRWEFS
jgi:hypothetical protein